MAISSSVPMLSADQLYVAFRALRPLMQDLAPRAILQPYPANRIVAAFRTLEELLPNARSNGGLINLWAIAGLNRDEVRNGQALAGLWMTEFGGAASRRFLSAFLDRAIAGVDWEAELRAGYRVSTEVSPIGDRNDRVDLAIETSRHTIGIELKIDANLGHQQLERYIAAITTRARWRQVRPHVVLLAPFASPLEEVCQVRWRAVAAAAEAAVDTKASRRSLVEQLIVSFGDHIRAF